MHSRIMSFTLKEKNLTSKLFIFLSKRSTADAIIDMLENLQVSREKNAKSDYRLLDPSKALTQLITGVS